MPDIDQDIFHKMRSELATIIKMESEDLTPKTVLRDAQWDSISAVFTMTLIDEQFNFIISAEKISGCITVQDIIEVVKENMANA